MANNIFIIIIPSSSLPITQAITTDKNIKATNKIKRVITSSNKWTSNISIEIQYNIITNIFNNLYQIEQLPDSIISTNDNNYKNIIRQINQKLNGYKNQDCMKQLFSHLEFITFENIIRLLYNSHLKCYYCNCDTQLLYEFVREPKQWTLERINNKIGHTNTNVVISCLLCNIKRKTMYQDRFLFTKQINIHPIIKLN